jgi:hypothetical protein
MSAHGSAPRKLFDLEMPARIAEMIKTIEGRAQRPIQQDRGEAADLSPVMGYFDDTGVPRICVAPGFTPTVETVAHEVVRLWFRNGRFEKNMPYTEMRHAGNRRLCRRLFRIIEQEVVTSDTQSAGVPVRKWLTDRFRQLFVDPLQSGSYRKGEADPGRSREGALDALEAAISEVDSRAAHRLGILVAELDSSISRPFGLMYRVVEQYRPFDGWERVQNAYFLAVPFLFDARKPPAPR